MCRNALILLAVALSCGAADEATRLYQQGQQAQRAGDLLRAYLYFARAAELAPGDPSIAARKNQTGAVLAQTMSVTDVNSAPDPGLALLELLRTDGPGQFDEFGPAAQPPHLNYTGVKKSFDITGDAKSILEKVSQEYGIRLIFAPDWSASAPFTLRTGDLDLFEAFRMVEEMTGSLIEPVDEHTALVARDTPQRRAEIVPVVTMSVPIPERFSVQDAQELVQAVQQTLDIRRAQVDPGRHTVMFRDSESKVLVASRLLRDLSKLRAQVQIDVQLLTITKNHARDIGLTLPNSSALVNFGNFLSNSINPAGFAQFATFGGGKTLFGLGVTAAQSFATVSDSLTQTLLNAQATAEDGMPVTLNVGTRYPVATAQFLGANAATTPTPTVSFQDLGLVLKVTPTVQDGGQVTLDVDAGFTTLGTLAADGIPSIAQRRFQGKVRLGQGEWAVLAGLTQSSDTVTSTGVAGLARLPLIGHLFRNDNVQQDLDETLIVLKPHITGLPPWDFPVTEMAVGTETRPISLY